MTEDKLIEFLNFYSAMIDIVQIFGNTEVGTCEVDEDAVARYCLSNKYIIDMWGIYDKEDIYKKITDDILSGMHVWEFLKISDWTKRMLEESFAQEVDDYRSNYKCFTCRYFKERHTSFGTLYECNYSKVKQDWRRRDRYIEPKKRCKNYEENKNRR